MVATRELTVEVDGPKNENLFFRPLSRKIRGRFDVARIPDPGPLRQSWPDPIPGQRLTLNLDTGEAAIVEPLHDAEHTALRQKIEKRATIPPAREELGKVDLPTWLHWLSGTVACGKGHVVAGKLPEKIDGKPKTSFLVQRTPDPIDRLAEGFSRLAEELGKQNALLAKLVERV
jgi:hypothetical protein